MADNTTLASGSGGDTIATDDISGVKYPRSKIVIGADGTNDGDVSSANPMPVSDAGGSLTIDGTVAATQSGTWTVTGAGGSFPVTDSGGSLTVDNAALSVVGGGAEATALRVTLASDSTGVLSVDDNGATLSIDDGGGTITVDGTVAVTGTFWQATQPVSGTFWQATQPVSLASLPALAAGTNNIGDVDVLSLPALAAGTNNIGDVDVLTLPGTAAEAAALPSVFVVVAGDDGTDVQPLQLNAAGDLKVSLDSESVAVTGTFWQATQPVSGTVAATQSGTWTEANSAAALTALQLIDNAVSGSEFQVDVVAALPAGTNNIGDVDVLTLPALPAGTNNIGDVDVLTLPGSAHDAAVSGNPVRVGARARTSDYTAVANDDTADILCDAVGKQVVLPYALTENLVSGVTAAMTGTGDTSVIAAAGAGIRNYVTALTVTNSHATVSTLVELKDGTTVIWRGYALAAGGGFTITFPTPLRGTANTAIQAACVTTGSNVYVSASGFKAP